MLASNVMNKLRDHADQVVRSPSGQHGQQSICYLCHVISSTSVEIVLGGAGLKVQRLS